MLSRMQSDNFFFKKKIMMGQTIANIIKKNYDTLVQKKK
jgi:hypothetical protein